MGGEAQGGSSEGANPYPLPPPGRDTLQRECEAGRGAQGYVVEYVVAACRALPRSDLRLSSIGLAQTTRHNSVQRPPAAGPPLTPNTCLRHPSPRTWTSGPLPGAGSGNACPVGTSLPANGCKPWRLDRPELRNSWRLGCERSILRAHAVRSATPLVPRSSHNSQNKTLLGQNGLRQKSCEHARRRAYALTCLHADAPTRKRAWAQTGARTGTRTRTERHTNPEHKHSYV